LERPAFPGRGSTIQINQVEWERKLVFVNPLTGKFIPYHLDFYGSGCPTGKRSEYSFEVKTWMMMKGGERTKRRAGEGERKG